MTEPVVVLETQIDDMSPQGLTYACERLLAAGALDVWTQAITMKKGRQGVLVQVLCSPEQADRCSAILFEETTTLGVRYQWQERKVLPRRLVRLATPWGEVAVKVAEINGRLVNVQPEYEDCARIARAHGLPWKQVHQQVLHQFWQAGGTKMIKTLVNVLIGLVTFGGGGVTNATPGLVDCPATKQSSPVATAGSPDPGPVAFMATNARFGVRQHDSQLVADSVQYLLWR